MRDTSLYELYTYAPTERLLKLRRNERALTQSDVKILFKEFKGGCESAGVQPTMRDFGAWLLGTLDDDVLPAEIVW